MATESLRLTQRREQFGRSAWTAVAYGMITLAALATLFPFYWEFVLGSHATTDIFTSPPPFLLGDSLVSNYGTMMHYIPYFWRSLVNSFILAAPTTLMTLFFSALGGYAFAKFRFPGKERLFWLLLATMMIPGQLGLIPWYIQMTWMGWTNTFWPFIVPAAGNAFGVFWLRQYIASAVPDDLLEAARMDGSSEFGSFLRIVLPLSAPALGALGINSFIYAWNSFLGPLIIMQTPDMFTYTVALAMLQGVHGTDVGALLVGSSIATIPMVLVTVFGSRKLIDGLTTGALTGQ